MNKLAVSVIAFYLASFSANVFSYTHAYIHDPIYRANLMKLARQLGKPAPNHNPAREKPEKNVKQIILANYTRQALSCRYITLVDIRNSRRYTQSRLYS